MGCNCSSVKKLGVYKIVPEAKLPERKTTGAAAFDVSVCFHDGGLDVYNGGLWRSHRTYNVFSEYSEKKCLKLSQGDTVALPTGLILKIPHGYRVDVLPRSGLSLKAGLIITNSPGTIDSDYPGELKIIVSNISTLDMAIIEDGMRIAQIKLEKIVPTELEAVSMDDIQEHLNGYHRTGGFGSTGIS